jgi:leader peptidase (prepilin peptidase)/N-methyltransferase
MPHALYIAFVFALGACVGSFLNVVIWRLPRGESLAYPPSHCPTCNRPLKWYDNIPVIGWLKLGGKCRFCRNPISPRYPIVESITGLLFVFYYVMFFIIGRGPCAMIPISAMESPQGLLARTSAVLSLSADWPIYGLYMFLIAGLLAASLIDAELFIIPLQIPWTIAPVAVVVHAIIDTPRLPGNLIVSPPVAAMALGGGIGLLISLAMSARGWLKPSFHLGEPLLESERDAFAEEIAQAKAEGRAAPPMPPPYTKQDIRREMRFEMMFLLPAMVLACVAWVLASQVPATARVWTSVASHAWVSAALGAVFGGLMGGFIVWLTRILGTIAFGRIAMGLGDADLMFAVGAVIGAGGTIVAFFLAPFFGIAVAIYMLLTGTRRELPYGPYLSLATAFVLLFYCPIAAWLVPGVEGLSIMIHGLFGGF